MQKKLKFKMFKKIDIINLPHRGIYCLQCWQALLLWSGKWASLANLSYWWLTQSVHSSTSDGWLHQQTPLEAPPSQMGSNDIKPFIYCSESKTYPFLTGCNTTVCYWNPPADLNIMHLFVCLLACLLVYPHFNSYKFKVCYGTTKLQWYVDFFHNFSPPESKCIK